MLFSSPPLTSPKVSLLRAFSGSAWGIVGELGGPVRSAIGSGIFSRVSSHWRKIVFGTLIASSMFAAHAFDLQGHRGARGLLPENTLAGFDRTLDIGVTTLELDIAITADGVPVIHHDAYLNPAFTRDAQGRWLQGRGPLIRSLTLAQLQTYDVGRLDPGSAYARDFPDQEARDGERVPSLAALFERVKARGADQVRFAIETKIHPDRPEESPAVEPFVDAVLAVIRTAGMTQRVRLISFDWRTLRRVRELEPAIETTCITTENAQRTNARHPVMMLGMARDAYPSVAHMAKAAGCAAWSPNYQSLNIDRVRAARALGLQVLPWTVNEAADMDQLIAWGVDGIVTDYPDRLRTALLRAGRPVPATGAK
ncbi:glycerophosphodiester phosphodiesterase [Ottowia caeni]|uniref:glycerophosphodiester phosphodiesterase n=1 Tax=Ottowia caeni TaxID=2870339 RepID=UPI003D75589E